MGLTVLILGKDIELISGVTICLRDIIALDRLQSFFNLVPAETFVRGGIKFKDLNLYILILFDSGNDLFRKMLIVKTAVNSQKPS